MDKTKSSQTHFPIEKEIGERVTDEFKNQIKGMMHNVMKKEGVNISNPEQTFAEITFSLLNTQQFREIDCFKHKVNIIASILRRNTWKTPYGFHKYWDIGQIFKERQEVMERKLAEKKYENSVGYEKSDKESSFGSKNTYKTTPDALVGVIEEELKTICSSIRKFESLLPLYKTESDRRAIVESGVWEK